MIDYDDLRQKAEAAIESNKCTGYYTYAPLRPERMLRLLDIVAVAKRALYTAYKFDASDAASIALDEIAKIEKE